MFKKFLVTSLASILMLCPMAYAAGNIDHLHRLIKTIPIQMDKNRDSLYNGYDWRLMNTKEKTATVMSFLIIAHQDRDLNVEAVSREVLHNLIVQIVHSLNMYYDTSSVNKDRDLYDASLLVSLRIIAGR